MDLAFRIPLYVLFGIFPSLIWLFYYLKKDVHPEPKRMILEVFLYGVLATVPVFLLETQLSGLLQQLQYFEFFIRFSFITDILKWFVVIALTEELLKYLAVKLIVLKRQELDEPLDIILYMIVVALGFAALENILYLFSPIDSLSLNNIVKTTISISFIRFIGATFLHTLCSGILGYFLAVSFLYLKKRLLLTVMGIFTAVFLHGLYNFSIITLDDPLNLIIPMVMIVALAALLVQAFNNVKKLKSICKI